MNRTELECLHYLLPIATIPSVMRRGLLSHRRSGSVPHNSIAMPEIQERRDKIVVPNGRALHEYVNLYFNPRNKMMSKVRFGFQVDHKTLCVLKIAPAVLDLPGVVITDQNASSKYRRFAPAPGGLSMIDKDFVFAESWTHPEDHILQWRHGSAECAEVLVPDLIAWEHVQGAFVSCSDAERALRALVGELEITLNPNMFFA